MFNLAGLGLLWIGLWILSAVGYVMNIVHLVGMDHVFQTGLGITRFVGLFVPPLGVFMGWFF